MKRFNMFLSISLILGFSFFVSGCDVVSSVKEYFSKDKTTQGVASVDETDPQASAIEETSSKAQSSVATQPVEVKTSPMDASVLAQVGSWTITLDEFNEKLKALKESAPEYDVDNPQARELILNELVRQEILIADAQKLGVANKKELVLALEEFKKTLLVREMVQNIVGDITVTEDDAKAFYEEKKEDLKDPPMFHVREIMVDTEEKAKAILVELLQGADFEATAKQKSMAKDAANTGGDLGFIAPQQIPFPEMGAALASLEPKKVSSVFKGPEGFYIIKLEEVKEARQILYEEVKKEALEAAKADKQQKKLLDYIDGLEKKMKVTINKDLLNKGQKNEPGK